MMGMLGKKKGIGALIISSMMDGKEVDKKEKKGETDSSIARRTCAEEMLAAIKSEDADALAEAVESLWQIKEDEEHEEMKEGETEKYGEDDEEVKYRKGY